MRIIELDATKWRTVSDFYDALLASIGAPERHGKSPDALIDSMIWGGMNSVEAPYTIKIASATALPRDVLDHIKIAQKALEHGRKDHRNRHGTDVDVSIEIVS